MRERRKVAVVVITSNRGLCGAFNSNIIKEAIHKIEGEYSAQRAANNLTLVFVGKKGYDVLRKRYPECNLVRDFVDLFSDLSFENISRVPFLPVGTVQEKLLVPSKSKADYIFEPDKEALLSELIPSILQITFQKFVLDNHASEHGARMTAMDNATTNAEELMKELKINYNKARQEAITKELSEIVGGAAALNG